VSLHLIRRTARAQWAALLTLGLLVLVTSFLVDAGPRTLVAGYDRAAHDTVAGAPDASRLIVTSEVPPIAPTDQSLRAALPTATADGLARLDRQWRGLLPRPLRDTIVTADYIAATDYMPLGRDTKLSLSYSSSAGGHIRYVSGRPPRGPEPGLLFEAALPVRAAQRLGVKVGDVMTTMSEPSLRARVTGLFTPADPGSAYWPTHRRYEDAELDRKPRTEVIALATALIDPADYRALCARTTARVGLDWTYTPGSGHVTAGTAATLAKDVHRAGESLAGSRPGVPGPVLTTRFADVLEDFVQRLHTAQTLLSLSLAGLFATALGVLVLATRLLLARLNTGLTTQAARGASRAQLAGLTAGLAGLVTVPAAVAGLALSALLVSGPAQTISFAAVATLAVLAIALPAAVAGRRPRSAPTAHRRLVAEGLLIVLAVAGTYVLRRRGLTTQTWSAGVDPYLSAVPALLAVGLGLLLLRLLPYPLRLAGRLFARGRSAAPFVGVARAARQEATAVFPLVVLLLAVTIIGFGSTVQTNLAHAQRVATYASVGGDARVDAVSMSPTVIDRVRRAPGVRAVVPAQTIDAARLMSQGNIVGELTAIGVDLHAYRRIMAGTGLRIPAWPATRPGEPAPALFSRAASEAARVSGLGLSTDYGQRLSLRDAGTVDAFPGRSADEQYVLVPADALSRVTGGGNTGSVSIFVRGDHLDAGALRRASVQPGQGDALASAVSTYAMTHAAFAQGELGRLVGRGFGLTGVLVTGYGVLAVLVILFAGARARGRTVSYLRTLGLSRRQARLLAFVEIAPMLFAASVAGWLLGLVLPGLLGPAIDLSPYTGGSPVTHYAPDLAGAAVLAGGLLAFAGLAVLIDAVTAARRGLGGVLRIGDT
jgi:putative ABC transport system permease protein